MKKTYWWRILAILVSITGIIIGYIIFYPYKYGLCQSFNGHCLFSPLKKVIAEPLFLVSLSLFVVSIFLFFIQDLVFLKWLRFALVWLGFTAVFVFLAPVYSGGSIGLNPTKELVSIWMGSLFVILSLAQIIWESKKINKKNK